MIGLERGKVTLYDHDPEWNKEAARTIKTIKDSGRRCHTNRTRREYVGQQHKGEAYN